MSNATTICGNLTREPERELFGGPVMSAAAGGFVPSKELFRALGLA